MLWWWSRMKRAEKTATKEEKKQYEKDEHNTLSTGKMFLWKCKLKRDNWEIGKSLNYDGLCKFRKYLKNLFHSVLTLKPQRIITITSQLGATAVPTAPPTSEVILKPGKMCCTEIRVGFNFWMNQRSMPAIMLSDLIKMEWKGKTKWKSVYENSDRLLLVQSKAE